MIEEVRKSTGVEIIGKKVKTGKNDVVPAVD
jgi:hypothetical protein